MLIFDRDRGQGTKQRRGDNVATYWAHTISIDRADLQDCKLSGPQGQDWHQSETYDKKGDCGEVECTKHEQAVPTANWNVKSAVRKIQGRIAHKT